MKQMLNSFLKSCSIFFGTILGFAALLSLFVLLSASEADNGTKITGAIITVILAGFSACFFYLPFAKNTSKNKALATKRAQRLAEVGAIRQLPVIESTVPILFKPGELCHYQSSAATLVMKNQVVGRKGGYGGISVRVAKGVTLHSGGNRGQAIRDDVPYTYPGFFTITSQRMIMTGEKGFEFPLSKLTAMTPYNGYEGIFLQFGRASFTLLMDEPFWVPKIIQLIQDKSSPAPQPAAVPLDLQPESIAEVSFSRIDPDENVQSPKGAELSYLDAKALRFWNRKHTDFTVPDYYSQTAFGRNAGPALQRLLQGGYLETGSLSQRIALKTMPELKAILAEKELKTSGNKSELVHRLLDNVPPFELEELFPVNIYVITEKGELALEPYSILQDNEAHALGLSYYRLIQAKERNPGAENNVILTQLLSEDLQKAYQAHDRFTCQQVLGKTARFLEEIGEIPLALETYSLLFFLWALDIQDERIPRLNGQTDYMAANIDRCGNLCGFSLPQLLDFMREAIHKNHPLELDSEKNVEYALSLFKNSLSIK